MTPVQTHAEDTASQIEAFTGNVDLLVRGSTAATAAWDEFRPRVVEIEKRLHTLAESTGEVTVEVVTLQEQWSLLQTPLRKFVDQVLGEDARAQRVRHERVQQRLHQARAEAARAMRHTFDALAQNLSNLAKPVS